MRPISVRKPAALLSPLAIPPLPWLGRWATRMVHGNKRSSQGYLLTKKRYLDEDQEWRLGQAYLGLLGIPLFLFMFPYVAIVHRNTGYYGPSRHGAMAHHLGFWSDMPLDLKILLPLTVVWHFTAIASIFRVALVWGETGTRDEIGE
jgi:hypothetical protein